MTFANEMGTNATRLLHVVAAKTSGDRQSPRQQWILAHRFSVHARVTECDKGDSLYGVNLRKCVSGRFSVTCLYMLTSAIYNDGCGNPGPGFDSLHPLQFSIATRRRSATFQTNVG